MVRAIRSRDVIFLPGTPPFIFYLGRGIYSKIILRENKFISFSSLAFDIGPEVLSCAYSLN